MDLRQKIAKHATRINDLDHSKPKLRSRIGHTPFEVLGGLLFGVCFGFILSQINKIIMIAIDRYIFFSFNKKKSIRIPMANMQADADKIAVLLCSGGKSGVPRMKAKNHMKLTPTEVLARKKPDCLRPVIKIKPVSAAVDRKDRTKA